MSLSLQITYHVTQGQLFQLPVQLPPDWEIESVELNPADQLRNWNIHSEKAKSTLLVDLQRPVTATDGTPGRPRDPVLTVRLNGSRPAKAWPTVRCHSPTRCRWAASLARRLAGHRLQRRAVQGRDQGDGAVESDAGEDEAPWGSQAPDHFFPYRGQAPQGTLTLRPRPLFRLRKLACARRRLPRRQPGGHTLDAGKPRPAAHPRGWMCTCRRRRPAARIGKSRRAAVRCAQAERLYPEELAALATAPRPGQA